MPKHARYQVETYTSRGLSEVEALTYIESIKTQELLSKIMRGTNNENKNDE